MGSTTTCPASLRCRASWWTAPPRIWAASSRAARLTPRSLCKARTAPASPVRCSASAPRACRGARRKTESCASWPTNTAAPSLSATATSCGTSAQRLRTAGRTCRRGAMAGFRRTCPTISRRRSPRPATNPARPTARTRWTPATSRPCGSPMPSSGKSSTRAPSRPSRSPADPSRRPPAPSPPPSSPCYSSPSAQPSRYVLRRASHERSRGHSQRRVTAGRRRSR
mmetsp:Transcript_4899/g.16152  ORF Transcript_4899/g.16152 Transcript_4899/m.16152 type:complete len:225 (-) Transcript_4899:465-1139(-)